MKQSVRRHGRIQRDDAAAGVIPRAVRMPGHAAAELERDLLVGGSHGVLLLEYQAAAW